MKKIFMLMIICLSFSSMSEPELLSTKMEFWKTQKKGANGNLTIVRPEWFSAAKEAGLEFIRFNVSWFEANEKDFLIGDVDNFIEINSLDLAVLIEALDEAQRNNQKIMLSMFELPGNRDRNASGGEHDYRLWQEEEFQQQAFEFWRQLAEAVKDHPAIVAYNPLNEPHPELAFGLEEPNEEFINWLEEIEGTTADLNYFNRRMVESIREVDPDTPIMLDGYFYTDPMGILFMEIIDDPNILYSFHNPAPWQFASYRANKDRYSYPDSMPEYWNGPGEVWTIDNLKERLEPVHRFIEENNLSSYQIVASEFWCDRRVDGCAEYMRDIISLYNEYNWHWAFYAFREDMGWTGLDYEMGDNPVSAVYWEALENGADYITLQDGLRHDNPIWEAIQEGLEDKAK